MTSFWTREGIRCGGKALCITMLFLVTVALLRPSDAAADGTEYAYHRAESALEGLLNDSKKKRYRHNWVACIDNFKSVYYSQPDGPWADDALYSVGKLYTYLYRYSSDQSDRDEALDYYRRLLKRFPRTPFRHQVRKAIAALQTETVTAKKGDPGTKPSTVKQGVVKNRALIDRQGRQKDPEETLRDKAAGGNLAQVENLRFWSNPDYTRVVIDVSDEVSFSYHLLKKDPSLGKPQRLYVDLANARIGSQVQQIVPIADDLLSNARAGQYNVDTVRVVVDIKDLDTYKIFSLKNPFRVVLDVNGHPQNGKLQKGRQPGGSDIGEMGSVPKGTLARQLALGVRRIVIDPGHGGKDPGATGYDHRVLEKDVVLNIAKRLQKKVRERLGLDAILTRDRDVFLSLEERTAIANTKNGDLFVSIHANASRNRDSRGIETYFLNLATDDEAIVLAARENATSEKNISDLEAILTDLMKNAKINESSNLAAHVQETMAAELKKKYGDILDHGVKQAPFYVLLGSKMPSVLVEVSFISNPVECRRLNTAAYQDALADALVVGIERYIQALSPGEPARIQAER